MHHATGSLQSRSSRSENVKKRNGKRERKCVRFSLVSLLCRRNVDSQSAKQNEIANNNLLVENRNRFCCQDLLDIAFCQLYLLLMNTNDARRARGMANAIGGALSVFVSRSTEQKRSSVAFESKRLRPLEATFNGIES